MAKKNEVKQQKPVISSIPVPPSDSALVIDLPDGQKLLVGKIETGTVIEVATWRGTGRPDSRTNRLMLGMSNEKEVKQSAIPIEEKTKSVRDLKFPENIVFIAKLVATRVGVLSVRIAKRLNQANLKKLRLDKFTPKKSKVSVNDQLTVLDSKKSLKIEEDFDADFQRILDEVAQRRVNKPTKSHKVTGGVDSSSGSAPSKKVPSRKKSAKKAR